MADKARCGCKVGAHPLHEDIDGLLKGGSRYGEIREFLLDSQQPVLPRYALSRHSRQCLKLEPRQPAPNGRKAKNLPETPELSNVQDLALALLYERMKEDPKSVATAELVKVLMPKLRKRASVEEPDDIDDLLSSL